MSEIPIESRYGRYEKIIEAFEVADSELGLDLWLIAERLMLYRLTRAGEQKRDELATLVHAIREIMSQSQGAGAVSSEIATLDDSGSEGFRGRADSKLTLVFSTVVDAAENMNSEELYRLIALLRHMEGPKRERIDIQPLERAEEFLSQTPIDEPQWNPLSE
ncbi:MAG: hypothetical protein OK439_00800 [Thaumarchaeota archaeon]|nr:hypothetical protein [Nitrososphaerota archaeon]